MRATASVQHIDAILAPWREQIGSDYLAYRNHVVRMATCCLWLKPCSAEQQRLIEVAACFHDIGLWTANTLDYLPPSLPPAEAYLAEHGLSDAYPIVREMILMHHSLRALPAADPLVELFRQGDWVDFSRGLVRFGLARADLAELAKQYPNAGFHRLLARRSVAWFVRNPFNPAPMMRW